VAIGAMTTRFLSVTSRIAMGVKSRGLVIVACGSVACGGREAERSRCGQALSSL
jgi:hypothetical protein